jgi:hypothetical protein
MREDITLSTGRIVSHKPYTVAGEPTGAIEAFILTHYVISGVKIEKHSEMTNAEWIEYCSIINPETKQ